MVTLRLIGAILDAGFFKVNGSDLDELVALTRLPHRWETCFSNSRRRPSLPRLLNTTDCLLDRVNMAERKL